MAEYAINGDIATLLGDEHVTGDPAALWVEASQPVILDGTTGRLGGKIRVPLASDGTFTLTGLPETVGGATPLYRLTVDSRSLRRTGTTNGYTTKWFPLTANRDLTWIVANYVDIIGITPTIAANVAAAAALGATNDTAAASFVGNPGSATRAALDAWAEPFVREGELVNNVKDFGATGNGSTNDTAAIQAAIDAGGITYFPPGIYSCRGLVAAANGTRLTGASAKGANQSILVGGVGNTTPILTGAVGNSYNWSISDLAFESAPGGGECITGGWAIGSITRCQFEQPNNGKSAISVSVWIDCAIKDYTVLSHTTTATVPTFKALSAVGDVAQFSFENIRFNNSGNYSIWLEATSSMMIHNARITNVNFEGPYGGAVNLLSCRNVLIENCGAWDMLSTAPAKTLINITKSTGADNKNIVIRNYMRDDSLAPAAGVYDIAAVNTTGLIIDSSGHPVQPLLTNITTCTGKVTNSPGASLTNGAYLMETDVWQGRDPAVTGTGTALGNGSLTLRQRRDGNSVEFQARLVLGSTTTIGSGGLSLGLSPAPAGDSRYTSLSARYTDLSAGTITPGAALLAGATVKIYTSTYGNVTATAPFTWATGDVIEINGSYEVPT